jgi:hypothetical protein
MYTKLDWVSFSFKRETWDNQLGSEAVVTMDKALRALVGDDLFDTFFVTDWQLGKGRAPYEASYHHPAGGLVMFFHTRLDHCLVEISGQGCDWMSKYAMWTSLLEKVQHRVTRIDVACDFETGLDPIVFARQRDHDRFRTHSEFVSESGTTAYVGSRSSNRYARVYRYNPPHERAHLLRVEHVLKADDAKSGLQRILETGLTDFASALGHVFGWHHPTWVVSEHDAIPFEAYRPERKEGKTLFWLADTIAPLLLRLEAEKVIDIDQWIADHLTPKRNKK